MSKLFTDRASLNNLTARATIMIEVYAFFLFLLNEKVLSGNGQQK